MKKITAKFNSKCAETGKPLKRGTDIYFDYNTRKAYHIESEAVQKYLNNIEADSIRAYIDAQESAYFDNITGGYYSR